MVFHAGEKINGFVVEQVHKVKELDGIGYMFVHEKSGARLFYLSNEDENKVFSVTFKTIAKHSKGVAHIIEHTLLCGSEKYPLKEPFVELIKGSLNTFLNAMTFPDKTMYPVASTNDQDFLNLIDVYMDGIFHPLILKNRLSFWQEGWHYALEKKEDPLTVGGVVYSEMQGAYSNPEDVLENAVMQSLFPSSIYGYDSGGNPDEITDLTYEEFVSFYQTYYTPQNSYFYFYGNGDMEAHLRFLDERYLSCFTKDETVQEVVIEEQKPFAERVFASAAFDFSADPQNENMFALNYVVGDAHERELIMGMEILEKILFDSETAPLKKALVKSGIAAQYQFNYTDGILQPFVSIVAKQSADKDQEYFIRLVEDTLRDIVREGLDEQLVKASINHYEFLLREVDNTGYPKGILYAIDVMSTWLYGDLPWEALEYEEILSGIKTKAQNGYFESLIQQYFLENPHTSFVFLQARNGYTAEKMEEMSLRLQKKKAQMSQKDLETIIHDTHLLTEYQRAPESEDVKNLVPCLKASQIEKLPKRYTLDLWHHNGYDGFVHVDKCRGIVYLDMHFPITCFAKEDLPYLALLCKCLGWFRTQKHSAAQLHLDIAQFLGDISFNFNLLTPDEGEGLMPYFTVGIKGLSSKSAQFFPLVEEILTTTKIDDAQQLYYTLTEELSQQKNKALTSAHGFASARLKSYFEERCAMGEYICGVEYFSFLRDLCAHYDEHKETLMQKLNTLLQKLFVLGDVKILIVCDEENVAAMQTKTKTLLSAFSFNEALPVPFVFTKGNKNEGFIIPSNVYYVAGGFNYRILGYEGCGELLVLRKYLSTEFLWNQIRAMGGAYGAMASIDLFGNFSFVSYRDPHLSRTLDVYQHIPEAIKTFNASDAQVNRMIIGTISDLDVPLSPYGRGKSAFIDHCRKYSYEKRARVREEVLSTDANKIRSLYALSLACMQQNAYCVFGRDEKINACSLLQSKQILF